MLRAVNARFRRLLAPLALTPLVAVAACGSSGPTPPAKPGPNVGTSLDGKVPAAIRTMPLVDASGHVRHLSDFAGKVVVLNPSLTLCQESCPMDTASLVETARRVDAAGLGKRAVFLTVTVDPRRDTPAQLAAYRKLYAGPSNWLTLTGTPSHLRTLWKYFGVWVHKVRTTEKPLPRNWRTGKPLTYDVQHSDEMFFFDGRGHQRFVISGMPHVGSGALPERLRRFLNDQGRKNLAQAGDWRVPQALQVTGWLLGHKIG